MSGKLLLGLPALCCLIWADSVTLRDGRTLKGKFVRGTAREIVMDLDTGGRRRFPVREVDGVRFGAVPVTTTPVTSSLPVIVGPGYAAVPNFPTAPAIAVPGVERQPSGISSHYLALGGDKSVLGTPTGDERVAAGGGRYRDYRNGSIYWHPATGAHEVRGAIRDTWRSMGAGPGPLGYPTSDELQASDGTGRCTYFQHGTICDSPQTGAHAVVGAIHDKWAAMGRERGMLGLPVAAEKPGPGGAGTTQQFQRGAITQTATSTQVEVK